MKLLISTAPTTEAPALARSLVDDRLVACVNIVPKMQSIYRWKGSVCDEAESMLFIKTTDHMASRVMDSLRERHSYEVPEIICLNIDDHASNPEYLSWVHDCVTENR
ncbi:MAG: divalent-cation tolerance protein CutA [Deltaproteobacteria bacterium]|nr:divalent-cation tolerance protein CutA [Deltaproteobacteria bacterium]MBN2672747.1 divalent-cation tolerance protein CutA [Deltaproteobacteria bacterium]